jgi:hypothetical protein
MLEQETNTTDASQDSGCLPIDIRGNIRKAPCWQFVPGNNKSSLK